MAELREFDAQHDRLDAASTDGHKHCMSFESRYAHKSDSEWGEKKGKKISEWVVVIKSVLQKLMTAICYTANVFCACFAEKNAHYYYN